MGGGRGVYLDVGKGDGEGVPLPKKEKKRVLMPFAIRLLSDGNLIFWERT